MQENGWVARSEWRAMPARRADPGPHPTRRISWRGPIALALAGLVAAGATSAAHAWGNLLLIEAPPADSTLAIGATTFVLPRHPGADRLEASVWPGLDYYRSNGFFVSTENGLGWNLAPRSDVQAGIRLWPQPGRRARDVRPGLSPIPLRIQEELFANIQALPALLLQSGWLYGSGPHRDGMQLEIGATSGLPIGTDLLAVGLAATYANAAHRQGYYGLSTSDALASGLAATRPLRAGWQDWSLTFSAEHRLSARWHVDGQLVVARLLGVAAPTPIVASRRQLGATFSLWYHL